MRRTWADARLDRWIERELTEGLSPRARARLHERLRRDPSARARYDRSVAALRVLEGDRDLAEAELDVVERWLSHDWGEAPETAPAVARWWPALAAALAAALVLLWLGPLDPGAMQRWSPGLDDGWQARGPGSTGGLALEALCGPDPGPGGSPSLRARDCRLSDLMGFAYRVPEPAAGTLTLFGVDAEGDPMFYLPTPVDPSGASVSAGRWQPLPLGVRLAVNHAPGALRVYGLVAPTVATDDEVRRFVEHLQSQPPAAPGDAPWIERVGADALDRLCPASASCHAAELNLTLRP